MLAVGSVTYWESHSPVMVHRHSLDWRLQTDKRFKLTVLHDGPIDVHWGGKLSQLESNFTRDWTLQFSKERKNAWGAYRRQEFLRSLDPKETPYVFFCCADDQISPKFVERVLAEFEKGPELGIFMFGLSHHHYQHKPIPLGTWPSLSHCDWASGVVKTEIAQKAGINKPKEYACDGFFWEDCFKVLGNDPLRLKVVDNILVFKN